MVGILKTVFGVFGVSKNEPDGFYTDLLLGIVAAFSLLIVFALLSGVKLNQGAGISLAVFVLCVLFSNNKRGIVSASLIFVGLRFGLAFFITHMPIALAVMLGCFAIAVVVLRIGLENGS